MVARVEESEERRGLGREERRERRDVRSTCISRYAVRRGSSHFVVQFDDISGAARWLPWGTVMASHVPHIVLEG